MTAPGTDATRIEAAFAGPDLAWIIERCRRRLERGRPLTGTLTRTGATAGERAALARVLGRPPGRGHSLAVRLEDLDGEIVDSGLAPGLRTVVEVLTGPLRDVAGERRDEQDRVEAVREALRTGPHRDAPWYRAWADALIADGTLTRLVRRGDGHLPGQAAAVLRRLPADGLLALPVLAENTLGDTKALAGTPLARLVLRALALRDGVAPPRGRAGERERWESAGVVADDLSSQVLVLSLPCREDHAVSRWLREAAGLGMPFRLTLHQLSAGALTPCGPDLFVCENPAVLRTAAAELGRGSAPLVCTEGIPSAACRRLVGAAAGAGVRVRWHADLDWTGLRTTGDAIARYGARAWRMSAADYREGLTLGESEPLRGAVATSGWDPDLAVELARHGRAVMEERVLPLLLADLAGAS